MLRPLIWPIVNAIVLVSGIVGALFFDSNTLIITLIVIGFITASLAVLEGLIRDPGRSQLPLWYVLAGLVTAGGFVSWLFSAMGEINILGLFIPAVGIIGLFVVARQMPETTTGVRGQSFFTSRRTEPQAAKKERGVDTPAG